MSGKYSLTPVELELMEILWKIKKGTVRDVMAHLSFDRSLAYTSVSTILRILQQKNILNAEKEGKQHIYIPAISKNTFAAYSVNKIVNQIFKGSSIELVSHLINRDELSVEELSAIQTLLEVKKKEIS